MSHRQERPAPATPQAARWIRTRVQPIDLYGICWSPNKKSPRPRQTLRIAPATYPRQFPSPRGNLNQLSRQVFWLMAHPTPRAFPSPKADSGIHGFRPHLQRRDREGFPPSSLTQESQCGTHSRRPGRRLSSSLMSIGPSPAHVQTGTHFLPIGKQSERPRLFRSAPGIAFAQL